MRMQKPPVNPAAVAACRRRRWRSHPQLSRRRAAGDVKDGLARQCCVQTSRSARTPIMETYAQPLSDFRQPLVIGLRRHELERYTCRKRGGGGNVKGLELAGLKKLGGG